MRWPDIAWPWFQTAIRSAVRISGTRNHFIVQPTGNPEDRVTGVLFLLTAEELAETDQYEGSDYKRAELEAESGRSAFVYVEPDP